MTQLRKTMLEELQRRNLSKLTANCYVRVVEEFSLFYHRPPDQLGPEQIREYQAHLFCRSEARCQHRRATPFGFAFFLQQDPQAQFERRGNSLSKEAHSSAGHSE